MHYELFVRPEAESESLEAYTWYNERVPGLGDQFLLSVDAVLKTIARNPYQFPEVHRTVRRSLLSRFPYSVFFVVEDSSVIVLAVFHAKRNPKKWKSRV